MTTSHFKSLAAGVFLAASGTHLSQADDPFVFNAPDLLLGIQARSGTGSSQNLFVNLGNTTSFLNNGNRGTITNIDSILSATYGSDWFERTDLWFGVAGNRDHLSPLFAPEPGPGEEPTRTWYVSRTAPAPGGSVTWPQIGSSGLGTGGTKFSGLKRVFQAPTAGEQLMEVAPAVTILDENDQPVAWNNSWTKWNPTPGAGFDIWTGGIQNNFGKAGDRSTVDVQRMVASTPGEFVVSISITSSGEVVAEGPLVTPSSPFEDWIATFPSLTNPADQLPDADPDNDGYSNLYEFAFGGSPVSGSDNGQLFTQTVDATGDSQGDLTITVEVLTGAAFAPSGNKMVASAQGVNYTIEGSLDLDSFDSQVLEVTPHLGTGTPKSGYQFKTFRLVASAGLSGKGFLRAGAELAP